MSDTVLIALIEQLPWLAFWFVVGVVAWCKDDEDDELL